MPAVVRRLDDDRTQVRESVAVWVRLLECQNRVLTELRRALPDECSLARFDLLANLERHDGLTPATLSRHMLVTAGNLTGLVTRAERDGLVVRRVDKNDRRRVHIHLTKEGKALIARLIPEHTRLLHDLLADFSQPERQVLKGLLGRLRAGLRTREH